MQSALHNTQPMGQPRVFEGLYCTMSILRPATGVVVVKIDGPDVGEFGDAPFHELARDVGENAPVEVFIDARNAPSASIEVSGEWANWMKTHRPRIQRMNMLCTSRFVKVTASFVQRYTDFGSRMRIYTQPAAFDEALRLASNPSHYPCR